MWHESGFNYKVSIILVLLRWLQLALLLSLSPPFRLSVSVSLPLCLPHFLALHLSVWLCSQTGFPRGRQDLF